MLTSDFPRMEEVTIGRRTFTMSELSFLGAISVIDMAGLGEDEWNEMPVVVWKF